MEQIRVGGFSKDRKTAQIVVIADNPTGALKKNGQPRRTSITRHLVRVGKDEYRWEGREHGKKDGRIIATETYLLMGATVFLRKEEPATVPANAPAEVIADRDGADTVAFLENIS
ncbi:MAG: hypothetical protein U1A25_01715 [Candidatus Sungbacteria bacterium]|nr:hypothetical protein [bacterium]MDZ4260358.1 hypothetical protein [Candidatus Sungbacteria bacterium]